MDLLIKNYGKMWKMTAFLKHYRVDWLTLINNSKIKIKTKKSKIKKNSKKQLQNVGILDSRWQEADFRKKI